jgi:hypothetical protein
MKELVTTEITKAGKCLMFIPQQQNSSLATPFTCFSQMKEEWQFHGKLNDYEAPLNDEATEVQRQIAAALLALDDRFNKGKLISHIIFNFSGLSVYTFETDVQQVYVDIAGSVALLVFPLEDNVTVD